MKCILVGQQQPVGVTSFNGRSGAVSPQSGDYTADQVGAVPVTGGTLKGDLIVDFDTNTSYHTVDFQWREGTMSSYPFPVLRGLSKPTDPDEAANKLYVDDATAGSIRLSEVDMIMPRIAGWQSVTYGDGKFVAVAFNSNVAAYSVDGITWTETNLPSTAYWYAVTYGDGKFVAVATSSNKVAYSTDGINWTAATLPSSAGWQSVTYGAGKFVAVTTSSNVAAYSTDGTDWTASTLPGVAGWKSVTYGGRTFVAVAVGSTAAYSTNGVNWTAATLPRNEVWQSVTYGDGKFVAVTYSSNLTAYSTNGINWTAATLPVSASWQSVTYGSGKFVAINYNSDIGAYSFDGIEWTETTLPTSATWNSITYGNNKFVSVAYNRSASYSTDGVNWFDSAQIIVDSSDTNITSTFADILNVPSVLQLSVTLISTSWASNSQTVSGLNGITASNAVIVAPNPSSFTQYTSAGIICTEQGDGTLTFTCTTAPTENISVNILAFN